VTLPDNQGNGSIGADRKLESWKEIAAYFERDLRTVIRWEKDLGLPVHRYPGKAKGRVYALASELQAWAEGPRRAAAESNGKISAAAREAELAELSATEAARLSVGVVSEDTTAGPKHHIWIAAAIGLLIAGALAAFAAARFRREAMTTVAVMPFENLGGQSDPAFVDGLSDEIVASLSRLEGVRVAGRSSTARVQSEHSDLRRIGQSLGVETVVEGSVQREGDHTHVDVQLNRTSDGFTEWSQSFDSNSQNTIQTEAEIAAAVARKLARNAAVTVSDIGTTDPEARALYLQGRYLWNQRNRDAEQKSVEYMRQAIAKDPNYAQAWSGLADSLMTIGNLEQVRPSDYLPDAREAARKALQLNPNLAEAHAVLGRIAAHYDYDWATAESEYKKAFTLNPSYATAHQYYALGLMSHCRFAEAQKQLDIARQLDPLALIVGVAQSLLRKFQRDYDGVIRESQRVLQLDPHYHVGYSMLATGYLLTKRWDDWKKVDAQMSQHDDVTLALASGDREKARQAWELEVPRAERGELTAIIVATHALRLGDPKAALDWLERSYQNRDYWLLFINVDPEMDSIRSDPRFQAIVKKLGVA
jgi:TolB-like protein